MASQYFITEWTKKFEKKGLSFNKDDKKKFLEWTARNVRCVKRDTNSVGEWMQTCLFSKSTELLESKHPGEPSVRYALEI